MTPPEGAERKAVAADLAYRENLFLVLNIEGEYVKVKYMGINYRWDFCFEAIETGNIHGGPDLRNVWLAKIDKK